jgi:hypothetical protein
MDCKCTETHRHQKQGSVTPFNNGTILTPSTNVPNLTFPVWNINERVVVPLVKTVHHSEIPDWLKNCDTTFKN